MLTHLHLLTLLISPAQSPAAPTESTLEPLERIAVGSCFRERGDAAIWDTITEADPDLLLLIGDNVYADSDDPAELEAAWKRLDAAPAFRTLKESRPLIAVWDDHDYGRNDAGREYPVRVESQRVFLDWLGVPADSPRREREGVHDARTFGPIGRRVQILTLDTRYHRTPLTRRTGAWPEGVTGPYMPGDDSDGILLGEAQWTWLEEQLREPADVRIIASSIQFAADPHGGETWSNFPHELERMHRTLARTGANGVVFVSGDRHAGEISVRPTAHDGLDAGYDLFDLTASALNQPRGWAPERNDARLGDLWFDTNFGLIEIDWEASPPTVSLIIRDAGGETRIRHDLPLDRLAAPPPSVATPARLERIAFGSCNNQFNPTPLWNDVVASDPDLFLFLGDNVYGDTEDMQYLAEQYQRLAEQPGFAALRADVPILATWDDHDFGRNDAGADYPMKEQSKAVMLDFFDEPADSPRRSRPGVHGAWLFGPPEERVQVVLLDLRSFKSPWDYRTEPQLQGDGHPGGYAPKLDTTATMLGEEQWQWLSEQLRVPARVRLIGSSLQALSEECHWEGWAMMPHERERLLDTVRDSGAGGVIFLSGDTHWAELTRVDPWDSGVSYPLHELTSSGLNQAWEWTQIVNPHRVGPALFEPNWGQVTIDWDRPDPRITLRATTAGGRRLLQELDLSDLQPSRRR